MTGAVSTPISPGRFWTIFALCFSAAALEGYDLQVVSVAMPRLRPQLGLLPQQVGVALSSGLMGMALGAMAGGILSDRLGRRGVLIISICGLGVATLLTAFVTSYQTLLLARILTGVAIGGAMPTLIAIVAAIAGRHRITTLVTAVMCGLPFGGVLAALAGLATIPSFGWRGLFVFGGVLTLLVAPLLMFGIPGVGDRAVGDDAHEPAGGNTLFGGGRILATPLLWLTFILTLAVFSLLIGWAPALVIDKGLPPTMASGVMLALNLSGIVGALLTGRLCDLIGVRAIMLPTYFGIAAGLALFAFADTPGLMVLAAMVAGFFILGAQFALFGIAPRLYPSARHGTGVGMAAAMGRIGSILGPIYAGWLLSGGMSADKAVLSTIPIAVAAGLALLLMTWALPAAFRGSRRPKEPVDPASVADS
ncbi:MFS transporter [Nitrospirillum iridis]|uniref:AAHS family 3-hydroxyphenylpropionic acid transporter n=1 Tax=Nitrospirillum iridis TaxID=765888 RepID=A0A7X0B6W1_9PROT|nr:MFS transporter [Nitrospirillum iridis]MBB6255264.1 AAHS family 3-hydroxyphenylpropionic acid transporter [Nitrospirillum iridis]